MPFPEVHPFTYRLLKERYDQLGKHTRENRWKFRGTYSPLLWYGGGHPTLDRQQQRHHIDFKVSFELLRLGLLVWVNDRSATQLMAIPFQDIKALEIHFESAHAMPEKGSLFYRLIKWGIKPTHCAWLAKSREYEPAMVHLHLLLHDSVLLFWSQGEDYNGIVRYFSKPICSLLFPVKVFKSAEHTD
ncbi:MAG: hypothetical protein KDC57_22635 [Saprospiraceae bacterium]|nr:hypothetical protein [Saprospiraceae bacterium]